MPALYFPWGQEQTSTQNGTFKFAGYWRDAPDGSQDYADQRYYNATYGRFWTPDPASRADLTNPQTFNQYPYVGNDPVNNADPTGLCTVMIGGNQMAPSGNSAFNNPWNAEASALGADTAYPYQGEGKASSFLSVLSQALGSNDSTTAALDAITYALSSNSGLIDIIAYSGGAEAFTKAYAQLSAAQQNRIGLILYIAPGAVGMLAGEQSTTSVILGGGGLNQLAGFGTTLPLGVQPQFSSCGHLDLTCFLKYAPDLQAMLSNGSCNNPEVFTRTNPSGVRGVGFPSPTGGGTSSQVNLQYWQPVYYDEDGPSWGAGQWITWAPAPGGGRMSVL
jgi:RHS repeat-associated protein